MTIATVLAGAAPAAAQDFPSRPVRVIVPQAPGGAADAMARLIADQLKAAWGQSVIVDHKPGGGAVLATQFVARSAPDGYTLGTAGSSLTINAVLRKDLPYRMGDVQPLARIGYYTTVVVAHPALEANNVSELVALARRQSLLYGSNGIGSAAHLAGELLNSMAGIQMQHVPYNGAAKMYTDLIAGRLQLGIAIASSAEPFVKSGQLKVIGVTNAKRSALFPQWPAIAEALPGYEAVNWAGLYGPAGLPAAVTEKISADVVKVLRSPETRRALTGMGIDVAEQPAADFVDFLKQDLDRITPVAAKVGPLTP
jgi:tripartite-type tricarboxylate transporter receptor subunit TctC